MAMPPILQRIENLRKSLFGTGTKLLGTIMPYGSAANTVCQGNDSRLSDARTPKAHNHSPNDLTSAVPVNKGGTGATTAEAARENLEITPENIGALAEGGKAVSATKADSAAKLTTARTISITGDVTGSTSFDGSANESIAAALAASGVTAGSYGPSANATPAAGATFNVPQVTVDAKGRVTAAVNRTVKIPAVPEYEGATADTAATSGLVPPAAAGDQNKYLGGDGQWHEIVAPSEITLSDSVTSDSSTTAASSKAVKTAYDRASIAITNASTAKSAADTAQEAADAAQATADTAQEAADAAQTTANEAKTAAQNAASAASTAQSTASAAQNTANSANTAATNAQNTANAAQEVAAALDAERLKQIGQIQTFVSTNLPEGWMICDGSSVLFADWPEFQQVYNEGRFTGMTLSAADPTQKGKFVLNGSTGVYLPDLEGLFVQASAAGTAGAYVAPGLPNITGFTGMYAPSSNGVSGAFKQDHTVYGKGFNSAGDANNTKFDASFSDSQYGASDTVQPPAVKYIMAMYLGKPNSAAA